MWNFALSCSTPLSRKSLSVVLNQDPCPPKVKSLSWPVVKEITNTILYKKKGILRLTHVHSPYLEPSSHRHVATQTKTFAVRSTVSVVHI